MFGFWKRQIDRDDAPHKPYDAILGELGEAIVATRIAYRRPGRIRYRGSWWPAECHHRDVILEPGMRVQVVRRHLITLIVEPDWEELSR
ncbi:MAG: NfeD family protein [Cyanobacteria bacterium SID2]|nr:NfeD family protein [Cyanobacteria bacterium SID2]MBP0003119.1 NfeD family protein [Cyanobacteria bacterium SBC]